MAPPPPTEADFKPLVRDFVATDTRHVRRIVGQDVMAMRNRANWQAYTNPMLIWGGLFPMTLLLLYARPYIPSLPGFFGVGEGDGMGVDEDVDEGVGEGGWRMALGTMAYLLVGPCVLIMYVQVRHHRIFRGLMQTRLAQPDMGNIVQHYQAPGGVVLVLPVEGALRGVVCVEKRRRAAVAKDTEQEEGGTEGVASGQKSARPLQRLHPQKEGDGAKKTWVVRHLVLDLPERTRRQAAAALMTTALERLFDSDGHGDGDSPTSQTGTGGERNKSDRVLVLTEPLALEGERFYHETGFTRASASDAAVAAAVKDGDVVVGADLDLVPATGSRGVMDRFNLDTALKGKRVWLEITRDEWDRRSMHRSASGSGSRSERTGKKGAGRKG